MLQVPPIIAIDKKKCGNYEIQDLQKCATQTKIMWRWKIPSRHEGNMDLI